MVMMLLIVDCGISLCYYGLLCFSICLDKCYRLSINLATLYLLSPLSQQRANSNLIVWYWCWHKLSDFFVLSVPKGEIDTILLFGFDVISMLLMLGCCYFYLYFNCHISDYVGPLTSKSRGSMLDNFWLEDFDFLFLVAWFSILFFGIVFKLQIHSIIGNKINWLLQQ